MIGALRTTLQAIAAVAFAGFIYTFGRWILCC